MYKEKLSTTHYCHILFAISDNIHNWNLERFVRSNILLVLSVVIQLQLFKQIIIMDE